MLRSSFLLFLLFLPFLTSWPTTVEIEYMLVCPFLPNSALTNFSYEMILMEFDSYTFDDQVSLSQGGFANTAIHQPGQMSLGAQGIYSTVAEGEEWRDDGYYEFYLNIYHDCTTGRYKARTQFYLAGGRCPTFGSGVKNTCIYKDQWVDLTRTHWFAREPIYRGS